MPGDAYPQKIRDPAHRQPPRPIAPVGLRQKRNRIGARAQQRFEPNTVPLQLQQTRRSAAAQRRGIFHRLHQARHGEKQHVTIVQFQLSGLPQRRHADPEHGRKTVQHFPNDPTDSVRGANPPALGVTGQLGGKESIGAGGDGIAHGHGVRAVGGVNRGEKQPAQKNRSRVGIAAEGREHPLFRPDTEFAETLDRTIRLQFRPQDYTLVMSRIAVIPKTTSRPALARRFLDFLLGEEGQRILAKTSHLHAIHPVTGKTAADALQALAGDSLRPIALGPGLLVYLDQAKHRNFLRRWEITLSDR